MATGRLIFIAAVLALGCQGSGMGNANIRVTKTAVSDCQDGTCVKATCEVTNVGIAGGDAVVLVKTRAPDGVESSDREAVRLMAGQSVDVSRLWPREDAGTKHAVGIECQIEGGEAYRTATVGASD